MLADARPLVTIGLPVHNGERYLAAALDSILAQTWSDFELIIADNASTDRTPRILDEYRQRDHRIRLFTHPANARAAANFDFTFAYARGCYFKWAAHDDLLAPQFLERCIAELEANPDAALCRTQANLIDSAGHIIRPFDISLKGIDSSRPSDRLESLLLTQHWSLDIFGLIRRDALAHTRLITPAIMSDKAVLAELALQGPFVTVPERLFYSREHAERSVRAYAPHRRRSWFTTTPQRIALPHWELLRDYITAVWRAHLPPVERFRCFVTVAKWALSPRTFSWMALDPVIALFPPIGDALWTLKRIGLTRT